MIGAHTITVAPCARCRYLEPVAELDDTPFGPLCSDCRATVFGVFDFVEQVERKRAELRDARDAVAGCGCGLHHPCVNCSAPDARWTGSEFLCERCA